MNDDSQNEVIFAAKMQINGAHHQIYFMIICIGLFYGRGLIVLLAGGGILRKPAASNTGSNSRTRPGKLPSIILKGAKWKIKT